MTESQRKAMEQALQAHRAMQEWIKAVPDDVTLPAMPGTDGDWLDDVEGMLVTALAEPAPEPVATITSMDEYGPLLGWHTHWAQFPVGTKFYTDALEREILQPVAELPEPKGPRA